jgi:hypothetical protein
VPATPTATLRLCWSVIEVAEGVMVRAGAPVPVTITTVFPEDAAYKPALVTSGV